VSPDPLPDLYKGEPIVLAAQIDDMTGVLELTGDYAGQPWQVDMDIAKATAGEGIGKLWARRKIASLEAGYSYGNDYEAINRQVETVALDHHLVSSRTSLVAVDVKVTRPSGEGVTSTKLPLNLPAGWDAEKWFEEAPARSLSDPQKTMLQQSRTQLAQLVASAPSQKGAASLAEANRRAVNLPQTATLSERNILLGLLLMLLAALAYGLTRMYAGIQRKIALTERDRSRSGFEQLP